MTQCNVFVVGADEFNLGILRSLPVGEECAFHPLLEFEQTQHPERYPVGALLEEARQIVNDFPGSVDAIVGWWDMPTSGIVARLCEERGLPGAPMKTVIACEHKYWSRLIQNRVLDICVPQFRLVDPFEGQSMPEIDLPYPYWLKPVKSFQSHLGFRIDDDEDLEHAIAAIRGGIKRMAEPFNRLLEETDLPPEIKGINGYYCIAEQLVGGRQCTAEGYVYDGEVTVYGIIDSLRYEGVSSFARYEYPSMLPPMAQEQIRRAAATVIPAMGMRYGVFNIEFFWNEETGCFWIVEINPRISQSHATLFEAVDGVSHQEVAVDLGLGRRPRWNPGGGRFRRAAKCFLRVFEDGIVTRVPDDAELRRAEMQMPDVIVRPVVREGQRLSEMRDEDSYSYPLAEIIIAADSRDQLLARYAECLETLPFEVSHEPVVTMQPTG